MICHELTRSVRAATYAVMGIEQNDRPRSGRRAVRAGIMLAGALLTLSGCISVTAPDKPIVIDLNFNVKLETTYKLAPDAANTIEKNPEIF
jgi:hypothetical protein